MSDKLPPNAPVVLIVDDEPDILITTAVLLKYWGYASMTASHPAMAFDLIEKTVPDLILTDYMMPWMSGRAFCERLKTQERTRDVPIILASAVKPEPGPWDAMLQKPVEHAMLISTIERLLSRRAR